MEKDMLQDFNTPEAKQLLLDTLSSDLAVSHRAKAKLGLEIAKAMQLPLKQGIFYGDTITGIFDIPRFEPGVPVELPISAITQSKVGRHIAYSVPKTGEIPRRTIEGDYISIPVSDYATSIDWSRKFAQYARYDVVALAMQAAEASIVRRRNNDGWHTILAALASRGLYVYDNEAAGGLFTKRLIALTQIVLRRNAGGNSNSINRGKLTHVALSPESLADVRSWDATQVDEMTRREIYIASEGSATLTKVFGVVLVDLDELGAGQEYDNYFINTLGGSYPGSKTEIAVGLDLVSGLQKSFVMPWVVQPNGQMIEMLNNPLLILENRDGYQGRLTYGASILDDRYVVGMGI